MTTPTDLQLKLALAKELPEWIGFANTGISGGWTDEAEIQQLGMVYGDYVLAWRDTGNEITPREWDWVVNEVIKKLSTADRIAYGTLLCNYEFDKELMSTWQQRAIAYFKTIGKEIV
jgi:hypothetical protein